MLDLVDKYQTSYHEWPISGLTKEVLEESGYMAALRQDGDQERLDNLSELMNAIVAYERTNEDEADLDDYLQSIALYTDYEKEANHASIKLMTIHTAKGSSSLMSSSSASMRVSFPMRVRWSMARKERSKRNVASSMWRSPAR